MCFKKGPRTSFWESVWHLKQQNDPNNYLNIIDLACLNLNTTVNYLHWTLISRTLPIFNKLFHQNDKYQSLKMCLIHHFI